MTDARPSNCREVLREKGEPYPKSGCAHCGNGGLFGCKFEKPPAPQPPPSSYPHVGADEIIARETGINGVTLTRHIEGYREPTRSEGLAADGLVRAQLLSEARHQLAEVTKERDRYAAMTAPADLVEFLRVSARQFEAYQVMAERALTAEAKIAERQAPLSFTPSYITENRLTGERCDYPGPCGWQDAERKDA